MPLDFLHGNDSQGRGEATCQFLATFTVRNQISSDVDFGRFCLIFVIFRYFWIVYRPARVQNRPELFAAKIRGPVGSKRAVHMCPNRQYRSPAGGTVGTNFDSQQLNGFTAAAAR